ncbi:uncharacterized protein LOC141913060 [Tubulanus polymorphus]|uniref:uncharacterized protein LOC141913060 n=1 Tax=Tubulanus polymorphus TaxID=672921 RepID=UPI003DA4460B
MNEANENQQHESLTDEQLFEMLENEAMPAHIEHARLESLKQEIRHAHLSKEGHGKYRDLSTEQDFFDLSRSEDSCVVHFYHSDFRRCAIMDKHLSTLAEKYFEVKFAKINAEKADFFRKKLSIQVLPTVICFKKGIVVKRLTGFQDLGSTDDFQTSELEKKLAECGVISFEDEDVHKKTIFGRQSVNKHEDSDSDSD